MYTYCVGLMPLLKQLADVETTTLKAFIVDDVMSAVNSGGNTKVIWYLEDKSPTYGFYTDLDKPI